MDWIALQFGLREKKLLLVVKCKTAMQANRVIDKGLAIGVELNEYTIYNVACK